MEAYGTPAFKMARGRILSAGTGAESCQSLHPSRPGEDLFAGEPGAVGAPEAEGAAFPQRDIPHR